MIDLIKAEQSFKNYLKDYDMKQGPIRAKVTHTYGVIEKSEYIAKNLGLNEEQIKLAKLIALLHDIGRFEQIRKSDSFIDNKDIDHAVLGNDILFKNNFIREFIEKFKRGENIKKLDEESLNCDKPMLPDEIKITGTKWSVDVEYKGYIVRFGGEMCEHAFYAYINSRSFIKYGEYKDMFNLQELLEKVEQHNKETEYKLYFTNDDGSDYKQHK